MIPTTKTITVNGEEIEVYRINNCVNGNPRYVIHFLSLGLKDYSHTKATRANGWSIYRAKWFGGGFVTQSYNIEYDVERTINDIKKESK